MSPRGASFNVNNANAGKVSTPSWRWGGGRGGGRAGFDSRRTVTSWRWHGPFDLIHNRLFLQAGNGTVGLCILCHVTGGLHFSRNSVIMVSLQKEPGSKVRKMENWWIKAFKFSFVLTNEMIRCLHLSRQWASALGNDLQTQSSRFNFWSLLPCHSKFLCLSFKFLC